MAWLDLRAQFAQYDVRAQRLDASGNRLWDVDGARVCSSVPGQQGPTIVGNSMGGAIVSYQNGDVAIVAATRFSTSGRTVTDTDDPAVAPDVLSAWPNPFHERVTLHFAVARAADIRLEVFDVRGRRVHQSKQRFAPGTHSWAWDGRAAGPDLPAGVYFTRIVWPHREETRRITKLR